MKIFLSQRTWQKTKFSSTVSKSHILGFWLVDFTLLSNCLLLFSLGMLGCHWNKICLLVGICMQLESKVRSFIDSFCCFIDFSCIPLQCIPAIAPERGWENPLFIHKLLFTLTSIQHHCLLECGKGLWNKNQHL